MGIENSTGGFDRRTFLKNATVAGAGAAISSFVVATAQAAQEPGKAEALAAGQPAQQAVKPAAALTMAEVLRVAREKLYPLCRVCPECNGVACAGEVPGFGGIGSGVSFKNNYDSLANLQLVMRTFHDVKKPDPSVSLFGETVALPVLSAATGGVTYNMGGKMTEEAYVEAIVGGCKEVGTIGLVADGIGDPMEVFQRRMTVVKKTGAKVIVMIKPKTQEEIIKRIRMVEEAGAVAFGIDIDSAGRAARAVPGQTVEPKTAKQLAELAKSTKLPFIIKGIMTLEEAQIAVDSGARGIVVSNHGGRVLDYTPGVAKVLPGIADKVKGKITIFADGSVRRGYDVLKLLALGAEATLCGRPLIRGAHGAGKDGVALMLKAMRNELVDAMVLTGTASARNVSRTIIMEAQA